MHWLLILALLASTTDLKNVTGSGDSLNRAAEAALRKQIGPVRNLRVEAVRRNRWQPGDFDSFRVSLDGASLDSLLALSDRAQNSDARLNARPFAKSFDIEDILKGDLGQILGGALGGKGGRIGRIQLNATNFSLQGVGYESLDADLGEIRFDWLKAMQGDFAIQSWQPGNLRLQLRADQAARLLAPRLPSVRDVRLSFDGGRALLAGNAGLYGINLPFQVGGRLSVRSNQVMADDLALSVAKLRLPSFVMGELQRAVNPLYDFDPQQRWPVAVNLQTAGAQSNVLSLSGGLQWVGFNRRQTQNAPRDAPVYQPPYQSPYPVPQPDYRTPQPNYPAPQPDYREPQPNYRTPQADNRAPDYQIY